MRDLDAVIRAQLDGWLDDICGVWGEGCAINEHDRMIRMRAAIEAVLDEHRHLSAAGVADPLPDPFPDLDKDNAGHLSVVQYPGGKGFGCTRCHYWTQGAVRDYGWCTTVRAVARELGIPVDEP